MFDKKNGKADEHQDQRNLRENHRQVLEREKLSILKRMQFLDPYDPYAHIKEFQKMHLNGQYLSSANYNHGMHDDDIAIYNDGGYFTPDKTHYFSIFVTYRFLNSHRQRLTDHDFWDYFIKDQLDKGREKKVKILAEL